MSQPEICSFKTLEAVLKKGSRPLCIFSGGLDGTYLLHKISNMGCKDVYTLSVNLGGDFDSDNIKQLAGRFGATSIIADDRIEEYSRDYVQPSIPAHATYLGGHPISASLSRPFIAKVAVETARDYDCDIIIHTSNRSQNSLRRFNGALSNLGYSSSYGSPFDSGSLAREEKIRELESIGIVSKKNLSYSSDSNFWCREFESGNIDDLENITVPEELYEWTKILKNSPDTEIQLEYRRGLPVALNGTAMSFLSLVNDLNHTVGKYGLGRYSGLEEIEGGLKVHEVREMPAAYILYDAYRRLEAACISSDCIREKMHVEQLWVKEAIEGRWFDTLHQASDAFIQTVSQKVTGTIAYKLSVQSMKVKFVKVEKPLYIRDRREYEKLLSLP